mmetsp:Transcript_28241/g.39746  ORF Transcript_28241/g.39746 Transcript_28241/m.39746 type:complete len:84 (+) Transcript_28241:1644-1895(+)
MGILLSYPMARFDKAEHALILASLEDPCAVVLSSTVISASITPGVRNTRCLLALDIDKFIKAKHAFVVQVVAPISGVHVTDAT